VYLYAACLAAMIVLLFSIAQALFGVVRIAAPGTTWKSANVPFSFFGFDSSGGSGDEDTERDRGIVQLIENGILAVVAGTVFAVHWSMAGRLREEGAGAGAEPRPAGPAPRPREEGNEEERPRPRQRPRRRPPS
jgi:hypothetical protein